MKAALYGIGVGPGDFELMTLKAVRIISEADLIAVPRTDEKEMTAWNIAKQAVDLSKKEILELYMPMTRDAQMLEQSHQEAAEQIIDQLKQNKSVAFLTLGDPSIYSTYIYLHNRVLEAGYDARLIPGVPSFCAVAARLNVPLCEGAQPLHIIPASYEGSFDYLDWGGTKVLMKSGREFGKVKEELISKDLVKHTQMVECCGMPSERVIKDISVAEGKASYFSTIIVKEKEIVR
ncbi:MAG: precorrin-2 C(20)-methyltransferase [Dehalobacter sp. 4CP]|uniref:precorrin-2 C(20)-methyltransferase n=1 Tax=Dehalobacter sp. CP TaxID=2594474 RepID=UPI0013C5A28E|nr:precorrin-2 C(20)-methyltransferase [Dehalobacter sp. 4CP]